MKRHVVYIIISVLTLIWPGRMRSASAQNFDKLVHSYQVLCATPDSISAHEYLQVFPNDFVEFIDMFGYIEIPEKNDYKLGVLYFESVSYICRYYQIAHLVNKQTFCQKIINISINGFWQADAVGLFQEQLRNLITSQPFLCEKIDTVNVNIPHELKDVLLICLDKCSDNTIESFWHFYLDDAENVNNELYSTTINAIIGYDRLVYLLNKEYCRMKKNSIW